jgi:hypothetical protein
VDNKPNHEKVVVQQFFLPLSASHQFFWWFFSNSRVWATFQYHFVTHDSLFLFLSYSNFLRFRSSRTSPCPYYSSICRRSRFPPNFHTFNIIFIENSNRFNRLVCKRRSKVTSNSLHSSLCTRNFLEGVRRRQKKFKSWSGVTIYPIKSFPMRSI